MYGSRKQGRKHPRSQGVGKERLLKRDCWRAEGDPSASIRKMAVGTKYQYLNKQDVIHGKGHECRSTPRPDKVAENQERW